MCRLYLFPLFKVQTMFIHVICCLLLLLWLNLYYIIIFMTFSHVSRPDNIIWSSVYIYMCWKLKNKLTYCTSRMHIKSGIYRAELLVASGIVIQFWPFWEVVSRTRGILLQAWFRAGPWLGQKHIKGVIQVPLFLTLWWWKYIGFSWI